MSHAGEQEPMRRNNIFLRYTIDILIPLSLIGLFGLVAYGLISDARSKPTVVVDIERSEVQTNEQASMQVQAAVTPDQAALDFADNVYGPIWTGNRTIRPNTYQTIMAYFSESMFPHASEVAVAFP